jgi:hypothetical protein
MTRTAEQAAAFATLRALARPFRFRVLPDAEGFPIIPGRLGAVEWYCDGRDCHGDPLPGTLALAVWTDRPRLFRKLWAIPGVRRWQTGDAEMRAVFPAEPPILEAIAAIIRARRRKVVSAEHLQKLRRGLLGATSRPSEPAGALPSASPPPVVGGRHASPIPLGLGPRLKAHSAPIGASGVGCQ